jgi:hypothetical protein
MKAFFVSALALLVSFGVANHSTATPQRDKRTGEQNVSGLTLSLALDKRRYKRGDEVRLQVMLINPTSRSVYVFRTLEWGPSASLSLRLRNAAGKEIEPEFFPDAQTYESPADKSAFLKLGPDHFLGAYFPASIKFLNFTRPGKYAISAEYDSPFSAAEVELKPFFGKENGIIRSNVVWIEVR